MITEEKFHELCHWCEQPLWRTHPTRVWTDDYGSIHCEFHPAVFDSQTLMRNDIKAPHQTVEQVQRIVAEDFFKGQIPRPQVTDNVVHISKRATRTQRQAAEKMLPRTGSVRGRVYEAVKFKGYDGMTDHELEKYLGGKHQTISSSRRSLVIDGYLFDSGTTRKNPEGFDCIVWVEKDYTNSPYLNGIG